MAATPSAPPWAPEDDLRLKNAIERGASLEALAKGAVRFSRKFTVRELQDRWHSLLYDADVSAEASARMLESEACNSSNNGPFSKSSKSGQSKGSKRKFQSIKKQYYALRKRFCAESTFGGVTDFDINFLGGQAIADQGSLDQNCMVGGPAGHGSLDQNCMVGGPVEPVFDGKNASVFRARDCVSPLENRGLEGASKEDCSNGFTGQVLLVPPKVVGGNTFSHDDVAREDLSIRGVSSIDFGNSLDAEDIGAHLWDVSAPEMPEEETIVIVDDVDGEHMDSSQYEVGHTDAMLIDGEVCDELNRPVAISVGDYVDMADSLFNDEVNSILFSSPKDVSEDGVPEGANVDGVLEFCEVPTLASMSFEVVSNNLHIAEMASRPPHFGPDVPLNLMEVAVYPVVHVAHEVQKEEMICTLNTEDPDIPCNDDFIFPTVIQCSSNEASNLETDQKKCDEQIKTLKEGEDPALVSLGDKSVSRDSKNRASVSNHDKAGPSQFRSLDATTTSEEANVPDTVAEPASLTAEPSSTQMVLPEVQINPPALDCEDSEEESNDDDDDDEDADIPYFSDIEAMILDMDLCPSDEESYITRRVSKYQHEDAKRTLIRLEQCAQSSMQRTLASKGALALLYDHHAKHYIKKTEVIIGRTTEDNKVDIDLGDNKVSRRQALIKMEADGSFSLKKLGKSVMFLNGKEVGTGESLRFSSSNLIEIREMAFVFEINQKTVKQFLANISKKSEDSNLKISPDEGVS